MAQFSIVIPVKKGKAFLQKCMEGILAQTYSDYEILVLADKTSNEDGTLDWLQSLQLPHLKVFQSNEELGIQQNWARIREIPKGDYFTILGYDDILYKDYLETIAGLIKKYPDATLYQTQFDFIDHHGTKTGSPDFVAGEFDGATYLKSVLDCRFYMMATGFMIRSKDYEQVGGMPVHYPNLLFADYELWLRLTMLNKQVVSEKKCFAFRIHQSTTNLSSEQKMLQAFGLLVAYLESLQENPQLADIIKLHGGYFLKYNCNYLVYRLIRKDKKYREGLKVAHILEVFAGYAKRLNVRDLNLLQVKTIRLAALIDSNTLLRKSYLLFKRLIKKPVVQPNFD